MSQLFLSLIGIPFSSWKKVKRSKHVAMRKLVTTLMFCLATAFLFAQQVNNEERIAQLPALIEKAAEQGNFEEAGKLQRELRIREDMREAVLQKNYERAGELQRELEGKPQLESTKATTSTTQTNSSTRSSRREFNPRKNFMFYVDFSPVGVSMFTHKAYLYDWQTGVSYTSTITNSQYAFNVKIGNRFYFGEAEGKKLRVGIDMNYISLNMSLIDLFDAPFPDLTVSIVRPGVVLNGFITENMGIDFQFNAGIMHSATQYEGFASGLSFNPHVKYWYKKISAGIDYNFGFFPRNDLRVQYIGLTLGIRR